MSEANGYATPEAFKAASQRRFTEVQVPGVGRLCIRSLNGLEFARIKAAIQRSVVAAQNDKQKGEAAVMAETVEYIAQCVVDHESKEPIFTDRKEIESWDAGLLEHIASECARHCDFPSLEESAKN